MYGKWLGDKLKFVFIPDIIFCGWLGSKHQIITNFFFFFINACQLILLRFPSCFLRQSYDGFTGLLSLLASSSGRGAGNWSVRHQADYLSHTQWQPHQARHDRAVKGNCNHSLVPFCVSLQSPLKFSLELLGKMFPCSLSEHSHGDSFVDEGLDRSWIIPYTDTDGRWSHSGGADPVALLTGERHTTGKRSNITWGSLNK